VHRSQARKLAFAGTMPAQAGTQIRLVLGRRVDGTLAPFLPAVGRGLFKHEGLDATVDAAASGSSAGLGANGARKEGGLEAVLSMLGTDAARPPISAKLICWA
jgi:hypothetical protein